MRQTDDPELVDRAFNCPVSDGRDPECCDIRAAGDDPCKGCEVRQYLDYEPDSVLTSYSFLLASYVQNFALRPDDLSWFDTTVLSAYNTARNLELRKPPQGDDEGES